ncbi:MAG: Undecaprenyl-diphosphatase [Frankiales bacterium]|nr:Undecaprenyl-diphosphatase [Frankiales bacterium]
MLHTSGDTHDFTVVNHFARSTSWLHAPVVAYASYGIVFFGLLLLAGYLLARRSGHLLSVSRSLLAGAGVLLAVAINQPIVHAVNEPRPYTRLPHALVLVHRSVDASFPSDHATMAGAAAVGLLLVHRRLGLVAAAAALLMAAARVYVGAHYPVDVVAGLAVGGLVALVVVRPFAPLLARLLRRLSATRLRPLLTGKASAPMSTVR